MKPEPPKEMDSTNHLQPEKPSFVLLLFFYQAEKILYPILWIIHTTINL